VKTDKECACVEPEEQELKITSFSALKQPFSSYINDPFLKRCCGFIIFSWNRRVFNRSNDLEYVADLFWHVSCYLIVNNEYVIMVIFLMQHWRTWFDVDGTICMQIIVHNLIKLPKSCNGLLGGIVLIISGSRPISWQNKYMMSVHGYTRAITRLL